MTIADSVVGSYGRGYLGQFAFDERRLSWVDLASGQERERRRHASTCAHVVDDPRPGERLRVLIDDDLVGSKDLDPPGRECNDVVAVGWQARVKHQIPEVEEIKEGRRGAVRRHVKIVVVERLTVHGGEEFGVAA